MAERDMNERATWRGPRIVRGSRYSDGGDGRVEIAVEEEILAPPRGRAVEASRRDDPDGDPYLAPGDRPSKFAAYMAREGTSGSGEGYDYDAMRDSELPLDDDHLSQTRDTDGYDLDADIFGQPDGPPHRHEYGDVGGHDDDGHEQGRADYLATLDDIFTNSSSPTVNLDEGRTPTRNSRDGTFARRGLR